MEPVAAELRIALTEALAEGNKSYELADACVALGLAPQGDDEDPFRSKRMYVRPRLVGLSASQLRDLALRLAEDSGDESLRSILDRFGSHGVDGELKNLIFAANGPKPRIVLRDAINNVIEIVENARYCLVYDRPLASHGLTWGDLTEWWSATQGVAGDPDTTEARRLYERLAVSLASEPERLLFRTYCTRYGTPDGFAVPALIPQVYLHYDPYTVRELAGRPGELKRQRMDFLLLLSNRVRVVLEVDGRQHYARDDGRADPSRYSTMVAEDRRLRLAGYEVYRFGGYELAAAGGEELLRQFFDSLLARHAS